MRRRFRTYWNEYWRIPKDMHADAWKLLIAYAMLGLIFLWFGVSAFGLEYKAIERLRDYLPAWFPFANLFLASLLGALVAGPLQIPPILRFGLCIPLLFSLSLLYLSSREHQGAYLIALGVLVAEAFVAIPWWRRRAKPRTKNGWLQASEGLGPDVRDVQPKKSLKSRLVEDVLLYVAIGVALVAVLLLYVLNPGLRLPFSPRWIVLPAETLIVFGYYLWVRRSDWGRGRFWAIYLGLFGLHFVAFTLLLQMIKEFRIDGYIFIGIVEWLVLFFALDFLLAEPTTRNSQDGARTR